MWFFFLKSKYFFRHIFLVCVFVIQELDVLKYVCNLYSLSYMQYTPGIDIWSIGCIFAEMLTGRPLFPGKNVVHQLDIMTDLLGTPPPESIARVSLL